MDVRTSIVQKVMEALQGRVGEKEAYLLDRGMPIQDVAAILGHADLKTTQIYCYISQANVKAAYCKYAI